MSKQFQPGDKVMVTRRGAIEWELEDYTNEEWVDLQENVEYLIKKVEEDTEYPNVELGDGIPRYSIHPDHFTLVEKQQ